VGSWFNGPFPQYAHPEYVGLRVPTLEEILQRYGQRTNYYIETKNPEDAPGMEEKLLQLLRQYQMIGGTMRRDHVLIQSFSEASLRKIHRLDPSLPLIQLLGGAGGAAIRASLDSVKTYAMGIGPSKGSVDAALVNAAHERCLVVHPYTVNETSEMAALIAMGVDGVFTNFLDRLTGLVSSESGRGKQRANISNDAATPCRRATNLQ